MLVTNKEEMSLNQVGRQLNYVLPASYDSVPTAFRSDKSSKPIPCVLQTVNVPSMSGNQSAGGSSILQIPCGASAGLMLNPYIRFKVQFTGGANSAQWKFKGSAHCATSCINRYSTFVNSVQVDNIQNAWDVYDTLLGHSTSANWLERDGKLMLGADVSFTNAAAPGSAAQTFCMPLIGLLGSQSALPLYLINGTLQVQIDWQAAVAAMYEDVGSPAAAAAGYTGVTFSDVQLVYDKILPETAFVDKVRADMMAGQKYVLSYTNYQSTSQALGAGAVSPSFNYGLNVSSLNGLIVTHRDSTALTAVTAGIANSTNNAMSSLQLSLDGRLISTLALDSVNAPAVCFAESQKALGRIFDASLSDPITVANGSANTNLSTYNTAWFFAGVSCNRVAEGLAFQGSPASVVSIQAVYGGSGAAAMTAYYLFISSFQCLIDATGSIELIR